MSIVVEQISKSYGEQKALNNVSFDVNAGEIVGFIGPNGAGKSTMMKIICSLLLPDSGKVMICGHDVSKSSLEIRRKLGYLPENNPLYTDMYVEEYLNYVAAIYMSGKMKKLRVKEVIEITGLAYEKHKKIEALSKGYRQRVGLAQAIVHEPEVLILDEPTSGLDPNQIIEIRNLISNLGKDKTVILSTHIMQEVEAVCKRVIILNKGQIVANDLAENIGDLSTSGFHTLVVEFRDDPDSYFFNNISCPVEVKNLKPGIWLLQTSANEDIREELFRLAVQNGLVILSLHRKENRLEEVFRELTR